MSSLSHLTIQHAAEPTNGGRLAMPVVVLSHQVLEKIFNASMQHIGQETGEALVGVALLENGKKARWPRLYILETVPPIQHSVRQFAKFEQGDEWQEAIFNWWHDNWELYRALRRQSYGNALAAKWDAPLRHLGDWHKQPDGMIRPSGGDMRTARRLMKETALDYLLMPIVSFEESTAPLTSVNTLAIATPHQRLRIDFWWLAKRGADFEPAHPILQADLPRLPAVVWWLANSERLDAELAALEAAGYEVLDIVSWTANGRPPLNTYLIVYKPGQTRVWLVVTHPQYPTHSPQWFSAPLLRPDNPEALLSQLYKLAQPIPAHVLPDWQPTMFLVEGLQAISKWERGTS
jgi:hypothetical protein